ncbi:hypothetical protein MWH28_03035 [Natroniella sulfidigena]|uniref:hypothetical protein n=1 Tax=Natroniella sulfidigena TaxID=723921 RepID=UPI00200AB710|nr:hypothetical protein [Natroniella sulfidigena]MCK8816338.1 hypothetical protein [Natroniella sulfidigena]
MKKISILLALALVLAMAVPAMAVDIAGEVEFEREYEDNDDDSWVNNTTSIELDFTANPADNVTAFVGLEAENEDTWVDEAWINVDLVELPGAALKAGYGWTIAAPQDLLYDTDVHGAEFSYAVENVAVSFASDLDNDDSQKFVEASVSDLVFGEVTSTATLNFVDNVHAGDIADFTESDIEGIKDAYEVDLNDLDENGFSIAVDNSHEMADFYVTFADFEESAFQLGAETDVLAPGLTVGFDYGQMDEGYLGEADLFEGGLDLDSDDVIAGDFGFLDDDETVIAFNAAYDVAPSLVASFEYAMHDADDDEVDVLTLGAEYDLAENTTLEFEFENRDGELAGDDVDEDTITTTLTTNF